MESLRRITSFGSRGDEFRRASVSGGETDETPVLLQKKRRQLFVRRGAKRADHLADMWLALAPVHTVFSSLSLLIFFSALNAKAGAADSTPRSQTAVPRQDILQASKCLITHALRESQKFRLE